MATSNIKVKIADGTYIQVGQALKEKSLQKIKKAIKDNLEYLVNTGAFILIFEEIQQLGVFKDEINQDIQKYHHTAGLAQFAGLNQKVSHYEIDQGVQNISNKLFIFEELINNLRSAVLGLPNIDYSVAVQDLSGQYYYITSEMYDTANFLLESTKGRISKNKITTNSNLTKKKIQEVLQALKEDSYFKHLNIHFNNMMTDIPKYSNPPSLPKLAWAAEVFEKHIQETGEKNMSASMTINWQHSWCPVRDFWDDYHATRPGYDKNGHYLTFATATQGGDSGQTQVKSFRAFKNNKTQYEGYGSVNIVNINNMQDIFSFWMSIADEIQNHKVSDKTINEILSVLLPNEKLRELGFHTLGNVRGLSW